MINTCETTKTCVKQQIRELKIAAKVTTDSQMSNFTKWGLACNPKILFAEKLLLTAKRLFYIKLFVAKRCLITCMGFQAHKKKL